MKKKLALILALMMVFALLTGCATKPAETGDQPAAGTTTPAGSTGDASTDPGTGTGEPLRMALMLSGPVNDGGWAASAYAGLLAIEEKHGVEVTFVESLVQSDFEEYFRSYAQEGYDVIFGHGYEFGDAAMKVAPEFLDTKFIVSSTNISQAPNVASMNTLPVENGFMQGTAAALVTKSNIIGAIGGMSIPSITDPLNAFYAGAVNQNPDIQVLMSLTGDFEDAALIQEHAQTMIQQGADVLMYNADSAGLGVLDVVKGTDIIVIPSIANQNDMAPDNTLLSGITDVPKGMVYVFDKVVDGTFEPMFYELGVSTGCVYYEVNEAVFNRLMTDDAKAKLQAVFDMFNNQEKNAYDLVNELVPADKRVG